jgi:hypothetical protein
MKEGLLRETARKKRLAGIQGGMKSWQGFREERRAGRDSERKEGRAGIKGGKKN